MNTIAPSSLEEAIRLAGEGWLIDRFNPPEEAMLHIHATLAKVQQEAKSRLGANAPDLSESALLKEYPRNPQKVRGFFQALGGTHSPQMLLMAWRIIQGMEIKSIQLAHERRKSFEVHVTLESPYGEVDPPYTSKRVQDFKLFRHVGILEIGESPAFDGFYALRVRE